MGDINFSAPLVHARYTRWMIALHSLPEPSAQGTLSTRPLEHLLLYVRQKSLSGSLTLGSKESALTFERGNLRKVFAPGPHLSTVIYELGLVNDATFNHSLVQLAKTKRLYGALLLELGALSRETIFDALNEQVTRKVAMLMGLPGGTPWAFQENYDALPEYGGTDWPLVDPLGGVWRGIKAHASEETIHRITKRAKASRLSLRPSSGVAMSYLAEDERAFAVRLGEGRPYPSITSNLDDLGRSRVLYFLMLASAIEVNASEPTFAAVPDAAPHSNFPPRRVSGVVAAQHPSFRMPAVFAGQPKERASVATTVSPTTNLTARKNELLALAAKAESNDPFALFGVDAHATNEEIRAQFLRLMRLAHPDRLPEELANLTPIATRLVSRLNACYALLSDSTKRAELASHIRGAQKEDAVQTARQALKLLERDVQSAVQMAKRALALGSNENPELQFACAWVLAHEASEQTDEGLRGSVVVLDRLIREHNDYATGYFYRAQLHKRLGNAANALRDLKAALECDENHLEATRELRLFRMRLEGGMAPEEALGITARGSGPERKDSLSRLIASFRKP